MVTFKLKPVKQSHLLNIKKATVCFLALRKQERKGEILFID